MGYNALFFCLFFLFFACGQSPKAPVIAQPPPIVLAQDSNFLNIGFYKGNLTEIDSYDLSALTHLIFCFTYLQGNQLALNNEKEEAILRHLVGLKKTYPKLKVMVSFGGWGGCKTCSDVFMSAENRRAFAQSVKAFLLKYDADGLDLDWESPVIGGYGSGSDKHPCAKEDKDNFTSLVKELRQTLDKKHLLCFDANSFPEFLRQSIDWQAVMPMVDWVNLMTYGLPSDLPNHTGHHTALYSSPQQTESVDKGVRYLDSIGVPARKIVIGAAFYAFIYEGADAVNHGLGRPAKQTKDLIYKKIESRFSEKEGYAYHWDSLAQAPFLYNPNTKIFVSFDDRTSVALKTKYAKERNLGGIMFWKLNGDAPKNGLLDAIDRTAINN